MSNVPAALYRIHYTVGKASLPHKFTIFARTLPRAEQFADMWCKGQDYTLLRVEFLRYTQPPLLELTREPH